MEKRFRNGNQIHKNPVNQNDLLNKYNIYYRYPSKIFSCINKRYSCTITCVSAIYEFNTVIFETEKSEIKCRKQVSERKR